MIPLRISFLGGVTRTLNISYLKAIPVGTSHTLIKLSLSGSPFPSHSTTTPNTRLPSLSLTTLLPAYLNPSFPLKTASTPPSPHPNPRFLSAPPAYSPRDENPHPRHRSANRAHHGSDQRPHDEHRRQDHLLHLRAPQGRCADEARASRQGV